jgi:nitric oxide reductase NorD protein
MSLAALKEQFFAAVAPHRPNEWEVEEYLAPLTGLPTVSLQEIFSQVAVIWPVSQSLCYHFLAQVSDILSCLPKSQLAPWVREVLAVYEEHGLKQAGQFMADVERNYLCRMRGEAGITFDEAAGRLKLYTRGIAGRNLDLAPGPEIYTDTATIFLPPEITFLHNSLESFLLYKLLITFQWGYIACGTFKDRVVNDHAGLRDLVGKAAPPAGVLELEGFCKLFADSVLAQDIYHLIATVRVKGWLKQRFQGLMRDCASIFTKLPEVRSGTAVEDGKGKIMEGLKSWLLGVEGSVMLTAAEQDCFLKAREMCRQMEIQNIDTMVAAIMLYRLLSSIGGGYTPTEPLIFQGVLKPTEVQAARLKRRQTSKKQFIETLAMILHSTGAAKVEQEKKEESVSQPTPIPPDATALLHPARGSDDKAVETVDRQPAVFIQIAENIAELPEALQQLAREISEDLGQVPARYISAALSMAGRAHSGFSGPAPEEGEELSGPTVYDEWDFRRSGFRKNWCRLLRKELLPVQSTFYETTLAKYSGPLLKLTKQFEMLRTRERFVKRQREGDDIDFDAIIESLTDYRAGRAPSEQLYVRLQRDERDIAVVFLVDMSSSTEGWVNKAIKEALVLISESLEVLGDRYAIFGFSGMRRLRSELYHIKHFDEPYDDAVKGRIAAIAPIEYTRMGPPIRHVTQMLAQVEARVRLLITLSDGKPEDYDDYKGDYAIEDTRHALIEAKCEGIHPFCITIDKKAHDYIGHMYGEVNYIFIDNVQKLPLRMPEIYRSLTT